MLLWSTLKHSKMVGNLPGWRQPRWRTLTVVALQPAMPSHLGDAYHCRESFRKGALSPQLTHKDNPSITRAGLFKLSWLFPLSTCSGKGFKIGSENPKILGEAEMKTSLRFLCIPPKACFCCSSRCVGLRNQNVKNSLLCMVGVFFTFLLSYWKQKNCAFVFCRGQYLLQQQELLLTVHIIKAGVHEHFSTAVGEPGSCFLTCWHELLTTARGRML